MKKLIIDAGSTKMEWILLEDGEVVKRFTTGGYNPNYNRPNVLLDVLYKELPQDFPAVDAVYYYGSGCKAEANREDVAQYLRVRFEEAQEVHVTHDLMAVCHALLGQEKGIACILGTGANSCFYDGQDVVEQAVSLGYLVGDEGSGCFIGRKLTRAYFYDLMPADLKRAFEQTYQLEIADFIQHVYREPQASKYLAQFAKFAGDHQQHPFMRQLVKECFVDFIKVFVLRYLDCRAMTINFVGSIAYYFQDLLCECLSSEGLIMGKVMRSPAEGLIQMYS